MNPNLVFDTFRIYINKGNKIPSSENHEYEIKDVIKIFILIFLRIFKN